MSGASAPSAPPLKDTAIRPTNLPASSSSSSSSLFSRAPPICLLPRFRLLLFLSLSISSSAPLLLLLLCRDWLRLEEGACESSLSDDEEELETIGKWAGLHKEAELRRPEKVQRQKRELLTADDGCSSPLEMTGHSTNPTSNWVFKKLSKLRRSALKYNLTLETRLQRRWRRQTELTGRTSSSCSSFSSSLHAPLLPYFPPTSPLYGVQAATEGGQGSSQHAPNLQPMGGEETRQERGAGAARWRSRRISRKRKRGSCEGKGGMRNRG